MTKYKTKGYSTGRENRGKVSEKKPSLASRPKMHEFDFTFFTLVIIIVCAGLVMVFSASSPRGLRIAGDSFHFVKKQLLFAVIGFAGMMIISRIDYRKYEPYVGVFMLVCLGLLVVVLIPGVGVVHNGARRWLPLPGFELQPSEFMKPVMAMFIAKIIQQKTYNPNKISGILRMAVWIGVAGVLMFAEPHVSGAVVICGIAAVVMFAGGVKLRYFLACAVPVIPTVTYILMNDPVRSKRILVSLNPFLDIRGTGYQSVQGLYAISSGGLFGQGLGQSIQKTSFLPEPYNDFIFAVICEELGLLGAILVIALFAALILRGIMIAINAPDTFSSLTVFGIMSHIAIQTLFNICVVACIIPNTGITLPFFSYGGTALIVLMAEMGIVLNISRYSRKRL
ncbi:MAG: putative lipid II flippase FtsW [Clostridia bacterium]|nr:putative lipid II flippase FtsW [Clostridia bacterium]